MARSDQTLLIALLLFFGNAFLASATTDPLDLAALEALYESLNSPPQLVGWSLIDGDPCHNQTWRGVTCSGDSVVSIVINGLGLGGSLGSELSNLRSLKELDVSYNNIGGEIPYGLPPNATYINLAVNNFTYNIPYSLHSLKVLSYMNVSHNSLSGPIGNVFTDMQSLKQLDLSFNHFTSDLPSSFGSLTNLYTLYLQNNEFTGSVLYLANLPLTILHLENNHFSGYVPKQFEFIPTLRIDGNLFQPGFKFPSSLVNDSIEPPLSSADQNNSHSPKSAPTSFGFPYEQRHNKRRLRLGAVAGIVCGVLFAALSVAAMVMIQIHKSHKSNLSRSKSSNEYFQSLPITAPKVSAVNLDPYTWDSPPMTSIRISSVGNVKPGRLSKRKSCSRRSRILANAKLFLPSELLDSTNNYSEDNFIGEGSNGRVYKAEFPNGQILAVKKIDMVVLAIHEEDEFLDLVWNMSRLRHPNIITIFGYSVEIGDHSLVYDYAKSGSLDDVISSSDTLKALTWKARVMIAVGVARALEYMHCKCSPPVAHGNVKASNILLDDELKPHISDCGLNALKHLIITKSKGSQVPVRPNGYAAPELSIPGADSFKSDVYSYGIVLLELLTGRRAFDSSRKKEERLLVRWASSRLHDFSSLEEMVDPAIQGTIPSKILSRFADIILLCIQPEPEFRSPMTDIADSLARLIQKMAHPHRRHCTYKKKLSSADASELNVSELSFKSTLAFLESPPSPLSN